MNVLERQGMIQKAEILDEIKRLQAKTPKARYRHGERRGRPRRSWDA